MRWWKIRKLRLPIWAWIGLACAGTLVTMVWQFRSEPLNPGDSRTIKPNGENKVRLAVSEETTRILKPLRADGYVDYAAAIDQLTSAGVTPENNSAVLFWRAMGPNDLGPETRVESFRRLDMEELPPDGNYLTTLKAYALRVMNEEQTAETLAAIENQSEVLWKRPWSKQEFPLAARWLSSNQVSLDLLAEASRRPRRYDPLIAPNEALLSEVSFVWATAQRLASNALTARAMQRIGDHQFDAAWSDLLACHRLARLAGQGESALDAVLAYAIEETAFRGDSALLQASDNPRQAVAIERGLDSLGPLPKIAHQVDIGERYMFLSVASATAREGIAVIRGISGDGTPVGPQGFLDAVANAMINSRVDWNEVMKKGNTRYDRLVAAYRLPVRHQQDLAIREAKAEMEHLQTELKKSFHGGTLKFFESMTTDRMDQLLATLMTFTSTLYGDFEFKAATRHDLLRIACALAKYRAHHGACPPSLDELAPEYLASVPNDIFTGVSLIYTHQPDGYQVYSVGANGKDDGGRSSDDALAKDGADDLVIRVIVDRSSRQP